MANSDPKIPQGKCVLNYLQVYRFASSLNTFYAQSPIGLRGAGKLSTPEAFEKIMY